jgi:prolyl oligopeptidase
VSDCGEWLLVMPRKLCKDNMLYFTRLSTLSNGINGKLEMTKVINNFEADYDVSNIHFSPQV